jgi:hypothetical protein
VGDNTKLCLKEMGYKGANVTSVVPDKVKLLVFVNTYNKTLVAIEKVSIVFSRTCYYRRRWKEYIINAKVNSSLCCNDGREKVECKAFRTLTSAPAGGKKECVLISPGPGKYSEELL